MSTRKRPCKFFNSPNGCRKGTACSHLHESSTSPSPGPSTPRSNPTSLARALTPAGSLARAGPAIQHAPRGICDFFWSSGSCRRGFDCVYRHERKGNADGPEPASTDAPSGPVDFFSADGLAESNGSIRNERHSLKPSEAHNLMKSFLQEGFRFETPARVSGFVRIFASVDGRNTHWDSGHAQAFLDMIVHGNAILRMGDVLHYDPVLSSIGRGSSLSFQLGYFPLLQFMTSDLILKSTMQKNINALYTVLENSYEAVHGTIASCVGAMVEARTWQDTTPGLTAFLQNSLDGVVIFKTLSRLLLEYFTRFKLAVRNHPESIQLVDSLASWFDIWADDVSGLSPRFTDPIVQSQANIRKLTIEQIREEVSRLDIIVRRESAAAERQRRVAVRPKLTAVQRAEAFIARIRQTYDPPGELREEGPRHDNDFVDIADIRIVPTQDEIMCPLPPCLPIFDPNAPHHHPQHSMERHLDIQFRLLREELISPVRNAIGIVHMDLDTMWRRTSKNKRQLTKLEELLAKKGGSYRSTGKNSAFFQLYTNVHFAPVKTGRRNFTIGLILDAPALGAARDEDKKKRYDFWDHGKRLQSGGLVSLILVSEKRSEIFLGSLASSQQDIAESSQANAEQIQLQATFFDPQVEFFALQRRKITADASSFAFLVDSGVMLESIRPFLRSLQTLEPTIIPFARYITCGNTFRDVPVLPRYARAPGFSYKLQCLARPGQRIQPLDAQSSASVRRARQELLRLTNLDESQAASVADTLTREVALIQGPPGTGKSFTGKEILRVLFASGIKPIVLMAFTNHALDHMLGSVLDAKITTNIVRLGSRSSDERIAEYNLHKLERTQATALDRSVDKPFAVMKQAEEQMNRMMESIQLPNVTWEKIQQYLDIRYPDHSESFQYPPFWIQKLLERTLADTQANGEWETATKKKKKQSEIDTTSNTVYGFWKCAQDILFIEPPKMPTTQKRRENEQEQNDKERHNFFSSLGFHEQLPPVPSSDRPTSTLFYISNVWSMSPSERRRLSEVWEEEIRDIAYTSNLDEYSELRKRYEDACQDYNDIQDEIRRRILTRTDLIGCTTTGAARVISLLTNVGPKVLMVEEAGQVLEAHVLSALVRSVEHLICIGDPQQLRPSLANFSLSMNSEIGKELYKFDRSLMERLHASGLSMLQIDMQRRMRPSISHFIRTILYGNLQDHEVVKKYPPVQGMQKDVFFLTHTHAENGGEDSVSKFNMFEVNMIRELVLYFLKQDRYSGPGDIAVLCAYLGQLQKVRQALRDLKIAVSVDERDEEELVRQGADEARDFEQVAVAKHIRLGTVDIFQGEEAKIVIVSLVRNSGSFEEKSSSIGFLKSSNRINVALSRAKHGLYILGNASNLKQNETWSKIIKEMEAREQIGHGLPIVCSRHPDQAQVISEPSQLSLLAPGGGCLLPCEYQMTCGHGCPSMCHIDLDNHRSMKCDMPCLRISCPRNHPCPKRCSEECGKCMFPFSNVQLPCGHKQKKVPCYQLDDLTSVDCATPVSKHLPGCEHSASMPCHQDPSEFRCREPCGGTMSCCSRTCKSRCGDCQDASRKENASARSGPILRAHHKSHPCERVLYCQHQCGLDCSINHECNTTCKQKCRQVCAHRKCTKPCSQPCTPCMEPCQWSCSHLSCPVLCGSICSRLPCDEPCRHTLTCGHACPSVCGEPCEKQKCIACLPQSKKQDIVDFIMQRTLADVDLGSDDVSERLITLDCGHIFTVETLDGHCHMSDYYEIDVMGRYVKTKSPPVDYQTPPCCPTCRGPITALRYGRVTKRANLDILEQNVASTMSASLDDISPGIQVLDANLPQSEAAAKNIKYHPSSTSLEVVSERRTGKWGKEEEPLPAYSLNSKNMTSTHGIASEEVKAWNAVVGGFVSAYQQVTKVATTRGPHVQAYEAALSTLYRLELSQFASNEPASLEEPETIAMSAVNQKIGQPPHKADTRFQLEAFFLSITLRFMLAKVARARIDTLPVTSSDSDVVLHRRLWCHFVDFLYDSCQRDSRKALAIAEKSTASRKAAKATIMIFRSEFEMFRFTVLTRRDEMFRTGKFDPRSRESLAQEIKAMKSAAQNFLQTAEGVFLMSVPSRRSRDLMDARRWFAENCGNKASGYLKEYEELVEHVMKDKAYQPLSDHEREEIVKAFNFSHRGHFYNCRNGHTFVITECGGATQSARCPECDAPIGGSNHSVDSSNTRAREFEEIAGRHGAAPSPWQWARGA